MAAWLASSAWSFEPGETVLMAALILGIGGITALLAWGGDRLDARWERRNQHRRFVRLSVAGYMVDEGELRLALPSRRAGGDRISISCWTRKGRVYLDAIAWEQLRDRTRARWDRLAEDKGAPPSGSTVLIRIYVSHYMLALLGIRTVRLWTFQPSSDEEIRLRELKANSDRLFDVTDLGIV
jgi:hypothetical protein